MKKTLTFAVIALVIFLFSSSPISAQMMGNFSSPSASANNSELQTQQQENQEGKKLLDQLNNKSTTCQQLTDDQFEKIGEYLMSQSFNDTYHLAMNDRMKSVMGEQGESQMHIALAKRNTGCDTNASFGGMMGGVGFPMMGLGYGNMMSGSWGLFGVLGFLFWIVSFVDLVLLGMWLWKQIRKK